MRGPTLVLVSGAFCAVSLSIPIQTKPADGFSQDVAPLLKKYCVKCHASDGPAAGLDLEQFSAEATALKRKEIWSKVSKRLQARTMPPARATQPSGPEIERAIAWISGLNPIVRGDPGKVTMRRLNRDEYTNTIRDLMGIQFRGAADFPSDDVGYGFDNNGDVLSLSPLLLEKYLKASEQIVRGAIMVPNQLLASVDASKMQSTGGSFEAENVTILATQGILSTEITAVSGGNYWVRFTAGGQQAGPDPTKAALLVDGQSIALFDVVEALPKVGAFQARVMLAPGKHTVGLAFLNDFYKPDDPNPKQRDRNLGFGNMTVVGPDRLTSGLPNSHRRIFFKSVDEARPEADLRAILAAFGKRAYRRPLTESELNSLIRLAATSIKEGDGIERAVQLAVQACLVSPKFLFRPELDTGGTPKTLNGYEMASRLSYFLWSSMPDDELFAAAEDGSLLTKDGLAKQTSRMLDDKRVEALGENFAVQWLTLQRLPGQSFDRQKFPEMTSQMKQDMVTEATTFFRSVIRDNSSLTDFLDAKYTFVNERIASIYGLPGITGPKFRRVSLEGTGRSGILTQPGVLAVTSNPGRTSPVKRGKWLLEQVLGTPPPPPPPNVGALKEAEAVVPQNLREQLEQHRKDPACASCHNKIDPLGFCLEGFDPTGKSRPDADTKGTLPDGRVVNGASDLTKVLLEGKQQFVRSFCEKLMIYSLGRGPQPSDEFVLNDVVKTSEASGYKFRETVIALVQSDAFRKKR